MRRSLLVAGLMLALTVTLACDDLDEFRISGDDVFSGTVVGSDSVEVDAGLRPGCAFVLCGFAERTTLTLRDFDPALAGGPMTKGTISTGDDTFVLAPLSPITGLEHDALSQYTFPGGGRVRNYMLGARFGVDASRYATVFVSLMEDGRIEVRVVAPSTLPGGGDALFGVFRLCRSGCNP